MKIKILYGLILSLLFSCSRQFETARYSSIDDLKGKKVGVLMGSTGDRYISDHQPEIIIQRYEIESDLLLALLDRRCEAIVSDFDGIRVYMKNYSNLCFLEDSLFADSQGVGFGLDKTGLRDKFNIFLKELRTNGLYNEIEDRWKKSPSPVLPELNIPTEGDPIIAATSLISAPYSYLSNGVKSGLDIEIMMRFAENQKRPITILNINFGGLISALASGKVDMIAAGLAITDERVKSVAFSDPYHISKTSVAILDINSANYDPSTSENNVKKESFIEKIKSSFINNILAEKRYIHILKGLLVTVLISILSTILGTFFGAIVCFMRMSRNKFLIQFAQAYIALIRGIPVLVLLMLMYYVVFANSSISAVVVAIITFALNLAAYVSEMFRSAIYGVDSGQTEAGIALGFTPTQTFVNIVMPQAIRSVIPIYKGEVISLIKMTSVVGYIAVEDLTKVSDLIRSRTFDAFFPLVMVAIIYFFIAWAFSLILDNYNHKNYSES